MDASAVVIEFPLEICSELTVDVSVSVKLRVPMVPDCESDVSVVVFEVSE